MSHLKASGKGYNECLKLFLLDHLFKEDLKGYD
jgi:hypothetical protein